MFAIRKTDRTFWPWEVCRHQGAVVCRCESSGTASAIASALDSVTRSPLTDEEVATLIGNGVQ